MSCAKNRCGVIWHWSRALVGGREHCAGERKECFGARERGREGHLAAQGSPAGEEREAGGPEGGGRGGSGGEAV